MVQNNSSDCNQIATVDDVLDVKALHTLHSMQRPGQPSLLAKVIAIYLRHGPDRLQTLQEAVTQGDPMALAFTAHCFRSDSTDLGATKLAELLRDLEIMGQSETTENADQILAQVAAEYSKVSAALQAILSEEPVGS